MTDTVTLTGVVATKPENVRTSTGLTVTNFRLASSQRRFDRATSAWVDGDTNWYTVNAYRWMANNVANSLQVGNHVVLTGRLRVRNWTSGDKRGTAIEVDVDSIGHDLSFGVSHFTRLKAAAPAGESGGSGVDTSPEPDPLAADSPYAGHDAGHDVWSAPVAGDDESHESPNMGQIDDSAAEGTEAEKVPF